MSKNNLEIFNYLRGVFIIQKLAYFFEKSFFFLFSHLDSPRIHFFIYLKKYKPRILGFHTIKNQINLKMFSKLNLKLVLKQFNFFEKSFFFKNRAVKNIFNLNFFEKKINLFFFFFILKKFIFKKFNRFLSFIFFSNFNEKNLLKLNFIFLVFFSKFRGFLKLLDLNKFYDWCLYHKALFKISNHKIKNKKLVLKRKLFNKNKEFKIKKILHLKKMYNVYKNNYAEFTDWMLSKDLKVDKKKNLLQFKNIFLFRFKNVFFKKFNLNLNLEKAPVKFSDSSMNKYISYKNLNKFNFFFLRKNRIFNKSRYSRNRQLYRTGFYWCLWLNIIIVYGLFFLFYRFTFNFGYIWWGLMFLFYSFIFSKVCKYNFYNIFVLINEFRLLGNWLGFLIKELSVFADESIMSFFRRKIRLLRTYNNVIYDRSFKCIDGGLKHSFVFWNVHPTALGSYSCIDMKVIGFYLYKSFRFYIKLRNLFSTNKDFNHTWEPLKGGDDTWFRHKTIKHHFKGIVSYWGALKDYFLAA